VTSYPVGMTMSNSALIMLSDALRQRRTQRGTRRRRLHPGEQALLVVADRRKGETDTDLAIGFGTGRCWSPPTPPGLAIDLVDRLGDHPHLAHHGRQGAASAAPEPVVDGLPRPVPLEQVPPTTPVFASNSIP
jgi:hypothetical protein